MIGSKRSGVFLSYARKDGEDFAASLREKLRTKASDITIKQDRLLLEGGVGWWKQLTEAIDSVEFLVLVMTPFGHAIGNRPKGMALRAAAGRLRLPHQSGA
jgi:TIR domain